jgi:antitoxin (DNA-binding transcriptional repressor) of toxin-antitoxin stability system
MKDIKVSELKAQLSRYLRLASRGVRIVVRDRDEPIAEIGPPRGEALAWRDRLAQEGRLTLGSQDWGALQISRLEGTGDIQASLQAVREERR